jgi:hypothetical protein
MNKINNFILPRPDNIVLGRSAFVKEDFNNSDYIEELIIGSLKARNTGFDFTSDISVYENDVANHFTVFVCTNSFVINFLQFNREVRLETGDYIAFPSECKYSVETNNGNYTSFDVYYWPTVRHHGEGSNVYKVVATLQDKYEVTVSANSQLDAHRKAYSIPLSEWKHLTPGGVGRTRKIIRWTEWGNFETTEIN